MGVRIILCFLLVFLSFTGGILFTWRFNGRVMIIRDIKLKFEAIEREVLFSRNALPDICERISLEEGMFADILRMICEGLRAGNESFSEVWKSAVKEGLRDSSLTREQIILVADMGKGLGYGDLQEQKKCFERVNLELDRMLCEAEDEKKRLKKMYMSLFIFGGMGLAIVLI